MSQAQHRDRLGPTLVASYQAGLLLPVLLGTVSCPQRRGPAALHPSTQWNATATAVNLNKPSQ